MNRLYFTSVSFIYEVNHLDFAIRLQHNEERTVRGDGNLNRTSLQFHSFDYLVQFEIAKEDVIAFADKADVESQVIVREDAFTMVVLIYLVLGYVSLGNGIVMVQSIAPL